MYYDVPLIADDDYVRFLSAHASHLESVHFSLRSPLVADARNPLTETSLEQTMRTLKQLDGAPRFIPRYLLVNARMQDPSRYFDPAHLQAVADLLEQLKDDAGLTGIVFSDAYYMNGLSKAAPSVCSGLEAVPSVNCMIDSVPRGRAWLRLVRQSNFKMPSRLVLDRSLNRDLGRLEQAVTGFRQDFQGIRLLVLANEGCLPNCPYKPAHSAHMAVARMPGCSDRTHAMNRDLGCLSELQQEPWRLFTSPFIRPEDVRRYEGLVDGVKLCGRERGGRTYLERVLTAYVIGQFSGNLLSILDTLGEFEERWEVRNEGLPAGFHDLVTRCQAGYGRDCDSCAGCKGLAEHVRQLGPGLGDFRGDWRGDVG